MEPSAFDTGPGRVETGSVGYFYHVPSPLPTSLDLRPKVQVQLSKADHSLGRLASLGQLIPNPHLLIRPYLHREAVLSSRIEGTQADMADVFMQEAGEDSPDIPADVREVVNYVTALERGIDILGDQNLGVDLARSLHRILLQGVRGEDKTPGELRTVQNWIGAPRQEDATYVPPAPDRLAPLLEDWQSFLQEPPEMPPLVQAALMHYQFEAIHPFVDGNGRIGRLLIILFLLNRGLLTHPLLYLSAYFQRHRDAYYDLLLKVSQEGAYEEWVDFFLIGVESQADDAVERAVDLVDLRESYRDLLNERDATATAHRLLDELFANPFVTIPRAAELLDVAYPTAQRAIEKYLEPCGILDEVTGKERYRRYVARDVLEALEADK